MQSAIFSLFFGIIVLLWTVCNCNASPLKRFEYRVARRALPKIHLYWHYLTERNFPSTEAHATRLLDFNRRKRANEYQDDDHENFVPYKNIGSLYVNSKNLNIQDTVYNYGAEKYPKPNFPPYGSNNNTSTPAY